MMHVSGVLALGVLSLLIGMVSSRTVYVRRGEDITGCMKCLHPNDTLELYRECGIKEPLLAFLCHDNSSSLYNSRILLDTSGRCWTLLNAGKNDSCLYKTHYHSAGISDPTTEIRVVDWVLFHITTYSSRLGLVMAVSVNSSAGRVTWEVDRGSLRLMDDNRTLIIPKVRRDAAERRFHARLTNPISDDKWDCQLKIEVSDPVLISEITCNISRLGEDIAVRVQSTDESTVTGEVDGEPLPEKYRLRDDNRTLIIPAESGCRIGITYNETVKYWRESRGYNEGFIVIVCVALIIVGIVYLLWKYSRNVIPETANLNGMWYIAVVQKNGSVSTVQKNESVRNCGPEKMDLCSLTPRKWICACCRPEKWICARCPEKNGR